jgi:hypothetical protein
MRNAKFEFSSNHAALQSMPTLPTRCQWPDDHPKQLDNTNLTAAFTVFAACPWFALLSDKS